MSVDLDYLYNHRSEPDVRAVLEDYERSAFDQSTTARLGVLIADATTDADANATNNDADATDTDATTDTDTNATLIDADEIGTLFKFKHFEDPQMEHGLCLVQIPLSYYRNLTIIGWARRKRGDEWELVPGARVITRKRGNYSFTGFDDLASNGPNNDYTCHPPMRQVETLHRLMIRRCKPADVKAWAEECPTPKNWRALDCVANGEEP